MNQKINIDLFDEEKTEINYLKSPFNYTGSKSNLMPQLKLYLPKNVNTCYDLFCGGGGFFVNILDDFPKIIANDIIEPLMEFYKWLQITEWNIVLEEINKRNNLKDDKKKYFEFREKFNQTPNCIDFFILVCSCTNNMMRFNKKFEFNQTWGNRKFNKSTEEKLKKYYNKIYKNDKISFFNKNFFECEIKKDSFIYMDPPYYGASGAGYNCYWNISMENKLYNFIDDLDNKNIKWIFLMFLSIKE
jgi:DNA adenine methylase Dam